jgi:aspartate carbamoyltransferase catalytic subunit
MKLKHFIESQQLDLDTIFSLFKTTDKLRKDGVKTPLNKKILATLFYEPSTRTRLSFEAAMLKLGGGVISTENAKEFSSAIKGESLEDTVRVISKYSDIIVIRHYEEGASKIAASVSPVPIINGGDGTGQHPTQALLDLYTIWKEIGKLDGITIVMVGDLKYGRTVKSLCYLLGKFQNIKIIFVAPKNLLITDDIKVYLKKHSISFEEQTELNKVLPKADVLYMTRIQRERMAEEEYKNIKGIYKITQDNLNLLKKSARILHPLPHVEEINIPIKIEQKDKKIAYFRQAENGLYIRMALISYFLEST